MSYNLAEESWEVVKSLLPSDWRSSAREMGALQRARGIKDEESLLRVLLMHTAGGLSLKQTSARASEQQIAEVSAVALFKRVKAAEKWLQHLSAQLVGERAAQMDSLRQDGRRWRILDASDIVEPGPTGSSWRVHYSLRLPDLACDFFEVTNESGGESLKRLPMREGDVVLADRGYGHREGVARTVDAGADVVVRFNLQTIPLCDPKGRPIDLLPKIRRLRILECDEWKAGFEWQGRHYSVRVCAIKKSAIHAARARQKAKRKSVNSGHKSVLPQTLELAGYTFVLTTLPRETYPAKQVLEIYRWRWQVELAFKRLKSLLAFGHVPKTDPDSCRGWLQGKVLAALLIDKILRRGRFFSPWGLPV